MKFTESILKGVKPKSKRFILRDPTSTGFALRVTPTGVKTFIFISKRDGKKTEKVIGRWPEVSVKQAREVYKQLVGELSQKRQQRVTPVGELSLINAYRLFEQNMKREGKSKRTLYLYSTAIYNFVDYQGDMPVNQLTNAIVSEYVEHLHTLYRVKGNRTRVALSSMYGFLRYQDTTLINPCANVRRKPESPKNRKLSEGELRALLPALTNAKMSDTNRTILLLCLLTGQRAGEVCGMRLRELDLVKGRWVLPEERTKARREHLVPLPVIAISLIRDHLSNPERPCLTQKVTPENKDALFASVNGTPIEPCGPRQGLKRLLEQLDLPSASPHDLRRTTGHHLSALGFSIETIGRLLNHAPSGVTARVYVQYGMFDREEERREALEAWATELIKWGLEIK